MIIDEHICGPDGFMRPVRVRRISHFQRLLLNLKAVRRSISGYRPICLAMRTAAVFLLLIVTVLWWGSSYRPHQDISNALSQDIGVLGEATEPSAPSESLQFEENGTVQLLEAPSAAHLSAQTVMTSAIPSPSASTIQFPGIAALVTEKWQFPLKIEPTTPGIGLFGTTRSNKRSHAGIDLYAAPGTLVYAMADGLVRNVEVFYQSLLAIEVENLDGTTIRYGELDSLVQIGDTVRQGQPIGKLRRNYDRTCMLHLEIYATIAPEPLTDLEDKSIYLYVPVSNRSYRRRGDLVDPSAVYSLRRP